MLLGLFMEIQSLVCMFSQKLQNLEIHHKKSYNTKVVLKSNPIPSVISLSFLLGIAIWMFFFPS